jgi:hypothetical protein
VRRCGRLRGGIAASVCKATRRALAGYTLLLWAAANSLEDWRSRATGSVRGPGSRLSCRGGGAAQGTRAGERSGPGRHGEHLGSTQSPEGPGAEHPACLPNLRWRASERHSRWTAAVGSVKAARTRLETRKPASKQRGRWARGEALQTRPLRFSTYSTQTQTFLSSRHQHSRAMV